MCGFWLPVSRAFLTLVPHSLDVRYSAQSAAIQTKQAMDV